MDTYTAHEGHIRCKPGTTDAVTGKSFYQRGHGPAIVHSGTVRAIDVLDNPLVEAGIIPGDATLEVRQTPKSYAGGYGNIAQHGCEYTVIPAVYVK